MHRQWLFPDIQNKLFKIYAGQIVELICQAIAKAEVFAFVVDETKNTSNNEQVSICLHYVLDGTPHESFLGFCETSSMTGKVLFNLIKSRLLQLGIEMKNTLGQQI